MRIGVVTSSYPLSPDDTVNAGVFVRDVAHELVGLGHEVHVITPRKWGTFAPDARVHMRFIPWLGGEKDLASVSMRNPLNLVRYATLVGCGLWDVSRYAHQQRLDALLAMWAIPSGLFAWAAWKRYGIPYGVWALGSDIWARHKYPLGDKVVRQVLREAAFCFADGVALAQCAAALANQPCDFVPSVRRLPERAQSTRSFSDAVPHFLFIGRYERNKGPDVLVEAMRLFIDQGNAAHLHIFGTGSLMPLLRERIAGYEASISLGGYADPETVVAYMQACDWLIIPSRIESIPLILVDALHMHIPVIATEVGDMGAIVREHGLGKVVSPEQPAELAAAMVWAATTPKFAFVPALTKAAETFNLMHSASRCVDALANAVEREKR